MKKMITAILTAALVLSIGAISTFAAAPGQNANYTDADNDGVCDNYAAKVCPQNGAGWKNRFHGGRNNK